MTDVFCDEENCEFNFAGGKCQCIKLNLKNYVCGTFKKKEQCEAHYTPLCGKMRLPTGFWVSPRFPVGL